MKNIYLIRHGSVGKDGHFLGWSDPSLTEDGMEQVRLLMESLPFALPQRAVCSPLTRCMETASLLGLSPVVDPRAKEINFGAWDGYSPQEISDAHPKALKGMVGFPKRFRFPDGESLGEFLKRVHGVAQSIEKSTEDMVLISHGGVIRQLLCYWLGMKPAQYFGFDVPTASLCHLQIHGPKMGLLKLLGWKGRYE
jgi:broad specificity phosphatase PhoE